MSKRNVKRMRNIRAEQKVVFSISCNLCLFLASLLTNASFTPFQITQIVLINPIILIINTDINPCSPNNPNIAGLTSSSVSAFSFSLLARASFTACTQKNTDQSSRRRSG